MIRWLRLIVAVALVCAMVPRGAGAQSGSLDTLVAPIALFPDPLVAQVLPASTFPSQVVQAAQALATGRPDQMTAWEWDTSIQALLSYPTVLAMMSSKIEWTTSLGQAVATSQADVLAAIQRVRFQAWQAGNLPSNIQQLVTVDGNTILIEPTNPLYIYVPQYDPVAILTAAHDYGYPLMTFGTGYVAGAATAYACRWGAAGGVLANPSFSYLPNGSYVAYHPWSGTYTGYDATTGRYGAYKPSPAGYGQLGAWQPPAATAVRQSVNDVAASQYRGGAGDPAAGGQFGAVDPAAGRGLGGDPAAGVGAPDEAARTTTGGTLGRGWGGGWSSGGDRGFAGWEHTAHGWEDGAARDVRAGGGGDFHAGVPGDHGFAADTYRGMDGGGWRSQMASDRGFASTGAGTFAGGVHGGFHGGGRR